MMISEKAFASFLVAIVADLLELLSVREKLAVMTFV